MMSKRLAACLACALLAGCAPALPALAALADAPAAPAAAPETRGTTVRYSVPAVVTFVDGADEFTQEVEVGACASDPGPRAREGYEFLGWFDASTGLPWDFSAPVADHMTLVARWRAAARPAPSTGGDRDGGGSSDAPAPAAGQLAKTGDGTPAPAAPATLGAASLLAAAALRARRRSAAGEDASR